MKLEFNPLEWFVTAPAIGRERGVSGNMVHKKCVAGDYGRGRQLLFVYIVKSPIVYNAALKDLNSSLLKQNF